MGASNFKMVLDATKVGAGKAVIPQWYNSNGTAISTIITFPT